MNTVSTRPTPLPSRRFQTSTRVCPNCRLLVPIFCVLTLTLRAEKLPQSPAQLREHSDLIVVGRIVDLQIGTERSHIETGFGNYDWAIDLTLHVTKVEKGEFTGDSLEARCFRIKSRKSVVEYMTPSGNHPIPAVGTLVRAHLYQRDRRWRVVFPNGLAEPQAASELPDAKAVQQLKEGGYTYGLPFELWVAIAVIVIVPLVLGWVIRRLWRWMKSKRAHTAADAL